MTPRGRETDRGTLSACGAPFLGYGIGLRRPHFADIESQHEGVDFFEILVENYMGFGGRPRAVLDRLLERFPFVLHGVGLSIGGPDPLDEEYLTLLGALLERTHSPWFSDHLCYSSGFGVEYHDLLPLPFTEEALEHVVARIDEVQHRFDRPFALENPSYYVEFEDSEMAEAEFVAEVSRRSGCFLLLDVNNVYVNSQNHGYDPKAFIDAMPHDRVIQIHMAGHSDRGDVIIDTHGAHVIEPVYDLFAHTLERTGPVSTLLEWDNDIPPLPVLLEENRRVREVGERVLGEVPPWRR